MELEERVAYQTKDIRKFFENVTVEPVILLFVFTSTLYQQITRNLLLDQTCEVHLGYNDSVCKGMSDRMASGYSQEEEVEVQRYVVKLVMISSFIEGVFPVCYLLFLGSWSDRRRRRKPLILAPIIGEIIAVVLLILNAVWFKRWPVLFTALAASLPPSISGGWPCFFLGVYSYISSLADDDHKTAKIGVSSSVQNISFIIGVGSSGLLLKPLGFVGVYTISLVALLLSLIYGYLRIRDIGIRFEIEEENEKSKICYLVFDFISIIHFLGTLKVFFKNGPNNRRCKMLVVMMCSVMVLGAMKGDSAVAYMYTRFKFGWDEWDFSVFCMAHSLMDLTGSFVALVILTKLLKWKDASLGIIALFASVSANLIYSFAPNSKYFYVGMVLELFYGTSSIALRSIIAKAVPVHELGQSNSVFGLCEAVLPSIFGPIYTIVYDYTIGTFPGTYYFISCGMYATGLFLFIWLYQKTKMNESVMLQMRRLNLEQKFDSEE